jgi:hypothetical protein
MAKSKGPNRKNQSKAGVEQYSSYNRALAKEANKYLGTRFNLRKKALSKHALKQVRSFERAGLLSGREFLKFDKPKPDMVALKVSRAIGRQAKDKDFLTISTRTGPRILVQNKPERIKRFKDAIKEGYIPGVTPVGEAGFEHIVLPLDVTNMKSFLAAMEDGSLNNLKTDDEAFGFKFFGRNSLQTFHDARAMRPYMEHYKPIFDQDTGGLRSPKELADVFQHFEIIRYDPDLFEWMRSPPGMFGNRNRGKGRGSRNANDRRERIERNTARGAANANARKRMTDLERVQKSRAKETGEQRLERLRKQRLRQANLRRTRKEG